MDFELTEEQRDIVEAVREFCEKEFDRELALRYETEHKYPFELLRKAAKLGFVGVHYPEEYGGQGLGALENALIVEEMCRADSGLGTCILLADFACEIIKWFGTHEQKATYLPKVCAGEWISAGAFTEPDHGSDITEMNTVAVKDGDEWVVNGTKTFISNGGICNFAIVLCQTNPNATPKYRGMSTIIVPKEQFDATDLGLKMGIRMTSTAELSFSDARVPLENLVGEENRGFYQVLEFFDESRIEVAAQALGIAEGALERAIAYAKERRQFDAPLADMPVIRHKIADMATKIEAAKNLVYKAAWNFDQNRRIDPKLTSMAKYFASRIANEVCYEAVQILGGYGYMTEYEVERLARDARVTEIYEGTSEIQKNTIADFMIGKRRG